MACPLTGIKVTAKKQSRPQGERTGARAREIARILTVARRCLIEMAATATTSASVLLCLFVVRHYT